MVKAKSVEYQCASGHRHNQLRLSSPPTHKIFKVPVKTPDVTFVSGQKNISQKTTAQNLEKNYLESGFFRNQCKDEEYEVKNTVDPIDIQ